MRYLKTKLIVAFITVGLSAGATSAPKKDIAGVSQSVSGSSLKIATWNVEHLAYPINQGCKPRTNEQFSELKKYAEGIDADIIGLQEVASKQAVHALFPEDKWIVVISQRPDSDAYICRESGFTSTQQKVAFAVRKEVEITSVNHLDELGLNTMGLRYGLEIEVAFNNTASGSKDSISVLNVHMKSGCFVDDYTRSASPSCKVFSRQAPILDYYVEEKEQQQQPYFIIGDFNHRLSSPFNTLTQALLTNRDGKRNSLVNTGVELIGCHPYYPAPIDHIFAGKLNSSSYQYLARVIPFASLLSASVQSEDERARSSLVDTMPSDHCAVVAELYNISRPLSNAVKWQTTSKEYQTIVRGTYLLAEKAIMQMEKPAEPWVVLMDIDETVLDNSAYQVGLDATQGNYTKAGWANWVKSEKATLTPGAATFIETVLREGGKVGLITNRDASLNEHTWRNLLEHGLPLTAQNACLIGRSQADITAIDNESFLNDKDLRRSQIASGNAVCFKPNNSTATWNKSHKIVMQIGDNIEDFKQVTQEHADVDAVLTELNKTLFLLPNPMYGSW